MTARDHANAFVSTQLMAHFFVCRCGSIPYRSRLRRGRKRGKDEIKFLSSSIARVAANDMTLANFKASSDELPGHWLSGLGRALPFNTYLRRIDFNK